MVSRRNRKAAARRAAGFHDDLRGTYDSFNRLPMEVPKALFAGRLVFIDETAKSLVPARSRAIVP
ncbi:hypothetical protein [Caldovatus aquaticus]|uniref:Transposase n=1 Tax=Caldovatus aquaticus TaxID=2865671 RepID=A0ABS7F2S7_9PROT|nr:hypothetical protein [Caldovatus aquaticus]MBW8269302.1 hypothetical protein [Caldovatus aquaticus]